MIRAATLFSGIGAPEVAMPEWNWIWHAEIERFPSAVMAERHPSSVNVGDVTADDFYERALAIGRPDVLVFGSPCQSYSVAGKRLGLDDPRGNLALVALGIVNRLRPAWFVFENVPGLLSSWSGLEADPPESVTEWDSDETSDFAAFLGVVQDIGYCGAWTVLDAQYAGVAQRRERVFFVGRLGADWQRAAAVLLEPESLCGHSPARGEAREDPTGTLAARTSAGGGLGTDFDLDGGLVPERAHALTSSNQQIDWETETLVTHSLRANGFDTSEDGTGRGTPLIATFDPTQVTSQANRSRPYPELSHTIPSNGYAPVAYAFTAKDHGADAQDDLSPTLRAGSHDASHANAGVMPAIAFTNQWGDTANVASTIKADCNGASPMVNITTGVRRLMPVECERLQGFPDHYTAITYRGKPARDGPRYKAIGNSMAVPVIRWILNRIDWLETHLSERAA